MKTIRLGTRGSSLALWQANRVREELESRGYSVQIIPIKTIGDKRTSGPIIRLGAQGVFTKEIQNALLEDQIDLAVHSLKDLPTESVPGLCFSGTLKRADVRDIFLSRRFSSLESLPPGSVIGTGSLRRKCQIRHRLQDRVKIEDIRGNIETRLKKLDDGDYDAIILAAAGLVRLGFTDRVSEERLLNPNDFYPAVGQGALGLETRTNDEETNQAVREITDFAAYFAVLAERQMLLALQGGCIAPIGAVTEWKENRLTLRGRILSLDASSQFDACGDASFPAPFNSLAFSKESIQTAQKLGQSVADRLLASGADKIIDEIRQFRETNRL